MRLSRPARAPPHARLSSRPSRRGARHRRQRAPPRAGRAHAAPSGRGDDRASIGERCGRDDGSRSPPAHLHRLRRRPSPRLPPRSARNATVCWSCATTSSACAAAAPPLLAAAGSGVTRPCCPSTIPPPRDARRGRHAAARGVRAWPPSSACAAALKFEGAESDRNGEGSIVGDGRRRRPAVRVPRNVRGELRQRRLVDRGVLGARRPPLARCSPTSAPRRPSCCTWPPPRADLVLYQGVLRRPHHALGPAGGRRLFFDCGASRNAYKHEGKKTIAYEIAEQSGWQPPDVVVAPVAVGETFIAAARGFREMHEAGWIRRVPRMVAAQATRANAVVRAFRAGAARGAAEDRLHGGGGAGRRQSGPQGAMGAAAAPRAAAAWPATRRTRRFSRRPAPARPDRGRVGGTHRAWRSLAVLTRLLAERALDPAQDICVILSETGFKTEARRRAVGGRVRRGVAAAARRERLGAR